MILTNTRFITAVLLAAFTFVAPANAGDRPFHIAANVGQSSLDDVDGVRIDDSTTAFRLDTGYRFSDWFGIDAAYVNMGTLDANVEIQPGTTSLFEASVDGFELGLVGRIPLGDKFAVFGRIGNYWWSGDATIGGVTSSESGNDVSYGIGAEFAINPSLVLTADWRRYSLDDVDLDAAMLGLVVRFGEAD